MVQYYKDTKKVRNIRRFGYFGRFYYSELFKDILGFLFILGLVILFIMFQVGKVAFWFGWFDSFWSGVGNVSGFITLLCVWYGLYLRIKERRSAEF